MVFHQHKTLAVGRAVDSAVGRAACAGRSGVSLMEVLISVFVISIGLLGVAALIPVANYALVETSKADRTAACGQAAMRDVRVRALADATIWKLDNTGPLQAGATYVVDPLGSMAIYGVTPRVVQRVPYSDMTSPVARWIFTWRDDKTFELAEPDDGFRPAAVSYGGQEHQGDYSWMFTVTPSPAEDAAANVTEGWRNRHHLNVSVAVFYRRDFGLTATDVATRTATLLGTPAGIQLDSAAEFETGQWILLVGQRRNAATDTDVAVGEWYRIVGGSGLYLSLEGPDWTGGNPATAVFVPDVLGVYSTTVELNRAPEWMR